MTVHQQKLIVACQYHTGDEDVTLALARLIADIEPRFNPNVLIVLARAFDCPESEEARRTLHHCSLKMQTLLLRSQVERSGYPAGAHGLWAGTMDRLYKMREMGAFDWAFSAALTLESDACPLRPDWLTRLTVAHTRTLSLGLRITGAVMDEPLPHVNGVALYELSIMGDYPSLMSCPPKVAWDLHHAQILLPMARSCYAIRNEYGTRDWTPGCLQYIAREGALIHGVKDDSVLRYVRTNLRTGVWREDLR